MASPLRASARPALRSVPAVLSRSRAASQATFASLSHSQSPQSRRSKPQTSSHGRLHTRSFSSTPSRSREELPLEGVTVVSLEQAIAAPFCTRHLAELGARVIKIERPGLGDFARIYDTRVKGLSSHFSWVNRSKESLEVDIKDPKDMRVLRKILQSADVMVQNLAPGSAAKMGLSFDELSKDNPGIIVCDISGYGSDGPFRDKKAYDLLIQSEAGLLSITGSEKEMAKAGISIADIAAGATAYQNILAALLKRGKTGKGSHLDVSMLESMAEWMTFPMYYAYDGATPPPRAGASHASIYPYGPFETGGGGSVMLGVQNEREWANLCSGVLGDASLATDERFKSSTLRSQNREVLREIIHQKFANMTADQVVEALEKNKVANAKVRDMQGLWEHPQLQARGRWTEVDSPEGMVKCLIPAGVKDRDFVRIGPIPRVGEHNERILREYGFDGERNEV